MHFDGAFRRNHYVNSDQVLFYREGNLNCIVKKTIFPTGLLNETIRINFQYLVNVITLWFKYPFHFQRNFRFQCFLLDTSFLYLRIRRRNAVTNQPLFVGKPAFSQTLAWIIIIACKVSVFRVFQVLIFPDSDWTRIKKLRIRTLFMQCITQCLRLRIRRNQVKLWYLTWFNQNNLADQMVNLFDENSNF